MRQATILAVVLAAMLGLIGDGAAHVALDPSLVAYRSVSGVSGNISSVGSDTLNNLMTYWA